MLATHDQFTPQMRSRLKTTAKGLGLVRLLQNAKRFEEARTTLYSLENGFHGVAEESDKPSQKPCNHPDDSLVTAHRPGFLVVQFGTCLPV